MVLLKKTKQKEKQPLNRLQFITKVTHLKTLAWILFGEQMTPAAQFRPKCGSQQTSAGLQPTWGRQTPEAVWRATAKCGGHTTRLSEKWHPRLSEKWHPPLDGCPLQRGQGAQPRTCRLMSILRCFKHSAQSANPWMLLTREASRDPLNSL